MHTRFKNIFLEYLISQQFININVKLIICIYDDLGYEKHLQLRILLDRLYNIVSQTKVNNLFSSFLYLYLSLNLN